MVKKLPCNAGDPGSIPGRGTKIPHPLVGELRLPPWGNYRTCAPWGTRAKARERSPPYHDEEPLSPVKSLCAAIKTQCNQTNKYFF